MGYITRIDSNGDAEGNFTLVARRRLGRDWGIYPVGSFYLNQNTTGLPVSMFSRIPLLSLPQPKDNFTGKNIMLYYIMVYGGYFLFISMQYYRRLAGADLGILFFEGGGGSWQEFFGGGGGVRVLYNL